LHGTGGFLFTIKGFAVFEKSNPIEPPVSHQKSANPFVLKARASGGFGFFRTEKMNHAMKNNLLKFSSASDEVKTLLDSNKENISSNSYLLHGALLLAFAEN
jgi:hypothetical protein